MGHAATTMLGVDGARTELRDGWWLALTGLPNADMNVALVHEADEPALAEVIRNVEDLGAPTLLMFAGDAERLADRLPAPWTAVGAMPIMAVDL